jgi:hypothetical protein
MASEVQKDEGVLITWEIFEQELVTRFGPTDYEIFDEVLACITQQGSLRDYQREFERLANCFFFFFFFDKSKGILLKVKAPQKYIGYIQEELLARKRKAGKKIRITNRQRGQVSCSP